MRLQHVGEEEQERAQPAQPSQSGLKQLEPSDEL